MTGGLEGGGGISKIRASVIRQEAHKLCENKTELNVWENFRVSQIIDTTDSLVSMFVVCKKKKQQAIFHFHISILGPANENIYFANCFSGISRRRQPAAGFQQWRMQLTPSGSSTTL